MPKHADVFVHESAHSLFAHQAGLPVHRILAHQDSDGVSVIAWPYPAAELAARYTLEPARMVRTVQAVIGTVLSGPWSCEEPLNYAERDVLALWRQHWPSWAGLRWRQVFALAGDAVRAWLEKPQTHAHLSRLAAELRLRGGVLDGEALAQALEPEQASRDRRRPSLSHNNDVSRPGAHAAPPKGPMPPATVTAPPLKRPAVACPQHVWWDGAILITAWADWSGAKHYADGRVIHRDGRQEYRAEWKSRLIRYPDGRLQQV